MRDEDWKNLDVRIISAICMCLTKNVLANVLGITMAKDLWESMDRCIGQRVSQIEST